jgi:hypothetical protein
MWEGQKLDRIASQELTTSKRSASDAARVNKHLVDKRWLQPMISARSAIRNHHIAMTMPWKDNGDRLLPRQLYLKFIEEHSALVREFEKQKQEFLDVGYPTAREQAEFRMGELLNEDDYPRVEDLRRRFYVKLVIDAVTEVKDFRVTMSDDAKATIQAQMEANMAQRINVAMGEVWQRLGKTLGHFAAKMQDKDAIFRDSTIENLREIVDLLPGFNILNDAKLAEIGDEIKTSIYGIEADDLRKNPKTRTAIGGEAARILATMQGFMPEDDQ